MWKYCEICYVSIIIYIKEKKSTNGRPGKKTVTTVATVPPGTVATVQNFFLKKKTKRFTKIAL